MLWGRSTCNWELVETLRCSGVGLAVGRFLEFFKGVPVVNDGYKKTRSIRAGFEKIK